MDQERQARGAAVGIVGAGQLARMTYQAAIALGLAPRVLATAADESAALVARDVTIGAPTSLEALGAFAAECDVVTFDHELVDAELLARLATAGRCFRPSPSVVALAQDKRLQRERLGALGCPIPPYQPVAELADLFAFGERHGWPVVAKARRGGYDGRGVWIVDDRRAATALFEQAARSELELLVEAWVPIEREVALLIARRPAGEAVVYPLVETVQRDGICHEVIAPAPVADAIVGAARDVGLAIAAAVDAVGILAVELFLVGGRLIVNELAARPHNSGHYSIEGCVTSQFENHLRAVLDWPLGSSALVRPAVATVNVLGKAGADDLMASLPRALAVEGASVHLYGKSARPGRKLGHVTTLGEEPAETLARARRAAALLVEPRAVEAGR